MSEPLNVRPSNSVEVAFYGTQTALAILGRSATGRSDLINSERVLREIKAVRDALAKLETACREDVTARKRVERERREEDRKLAARQSRYLAKHPEELARAIALGAVKPTPAPVETVATPTLTVVDAPAEALQEAA